MFSMLTLVSIHTPTWGVTGVCIGVGGVSGCFNPHSHMGSDVCKVLAFAILSEVSIHTPTWGVTCFGVRLVVTTVFQSTLPHGE